MQAGRMFTDTEQASLLSIAYNAIAGGVRNGIAGAIEPASYTDKLRAVSATFITLKNADALRGCIGTLEAARPLVLDVHENAFAAAFRDPRFPPVAERELDGLQISISVLSCPEPMAFGSEQELLDQLRSGVDGLILEEGYRRSTFLPAVWESLPHPQAFFRQLKLKAGLRPDHWSDTLRVYRYHTEVIGGA